MIIVVLVIQSGAGARYSACILPIARVRPVAYVALFGSDNPYYSIDILLGVRLSDILQVVAVDSQSCVAVALVRHHHEVES